MVEHDCFDREIKPLQFKQFEESVWNFGRHNNANAGPNGSALREHDAKKPGRVADAFGLITILAKLLEELACQASSLCI